MIRVKNLSVLLTFVLPVTAIVAGARAQDLEPRAPGRGQGRVDARRSQSSFRRHLTRAR